MPTISYAVTACNESVELGRLLEQLSRCADKEDEIVVQVDTETVTKEVSQVFQYFKKEHYPNGNLFIVYNYLNKNFANHKNHLKSFCKKDYIFFIDADEYLSYVLETSLKDLLEDDGGTTDCFLVPRANTVEGLTDEHVAKWGWRVDNRRFVNWPDYQSRIVKNDSRIRWEGKVHERITGHSTYAFLPDDDETWALHHPKDIKRQEKQNNFYSSI